MARRLLLGVGLLLATAPAASAAELQAAFDTYAPGQGFQIGLIDAATGAARPLPAGVNTTDDELHPALSPDGRWLAFTRMKIVPRLDGNFDVPAQRTVVLVDLRAGAVVPFTAGADGAGPTFMGSDLTWGVTPAPIGSLEGSTRLAGTVQTEQLPGGSAGFLHSNASTALLVPHAGLVRDAFGEPSSNTFCQAPCTRAIRYFTLLEGGAVRTRLQVVGRSVTTNSAIPTTLQALDVSGAGHADPRDDEFTALDRNGDIQTLTFPGDTATTVAPAPITTSADERMPAWSPDGFQLGFVRTVSGRRKLGIYDLTPGLQTIVNGLVDIGADAPTPQTRAFQGIWGGLSLAPIPAAPAVTCTAQCIAVLTSSGVLRPVVTGRSKIGIFIVKRTGGTRKVLGVEQPRIKFVARIPLGTAKKGVNRFVLKQRLTPGKYLLTYRLLKGDKVTSVSKSIPLTVKRRRE